MSGPLSNASLDQRMIRSVVLACVLALMSCATTHAPASSATDRRSLCRDPALLCSGDGDAGMGDGRQAMHR